MQIITINNAEIFIEKNYLTECEIQEIVERIKKSILDVKNYLGRNYTKIDTDKKKLQYTIKSGKFISNAYNGCISLSYVKEKRSPYVHETVHLLASYNLDEKWLSEGLVVFLNDYLEGYPSFPNYGEDIDVLSKKFLLSNNYKKVFSFENKYANPKFNDKEKRRVFYIISGSLVKFIIEKYGKEIFLQIYNSKNIKKVTNKNFNQIKDKWIDYINKL